MPRWPIRELYAGFYNGRHTWASNVRILLSRYGFGHVWLNQGVGDPIRFIKEFYQRICDCATQEWNTQK